MAENDPSSSDLIRQLHLFSQVPDIYLSDTQEELAGVIKEDADNLACIDPPLTHEDIGNAMQELDQNLREVMRQSEFGKLLQKDYGYTDEEFPPIPNFRVIATKSQAAWLNALHTKEGSWDITNMQTGSRIEIHRSLLPLIGSLGYYGSHEDRATPQEIAYTLDIRPLSLPEDDPILQMISNLKDGNTSRVVIQTLDHMERYKNIQRLLPQELRGTCCLRPSTLEEAEAIRMCFGQQYFVDVPAYARGKQVLSNLPWRKNGGPL